MTNPGVHLELMPAQKFVVFIVVYTDARKRPIIENQNSYCNAQKTISAIDFRSALC